MSLLGDGGGADEFTDEIVQSARSGRPARRPRVLLRRRGIRVPDILENTLAGVLLLFRQPFRSGDQIEVDDHIGTVEAITIRETRLRSFDRQLVIIPNRDVYKNAIRVQTDTPSIRWDFCLGVAYGTDLDRLVPELVASVASVRGVAENPDPLVLVRELAASSVNLEVRFWAAAVELDGLTVLSHAFRAALRTAERLGVDITPDVLRLVDGPSPPPGPPT